MDASPDESELERLRDLAGSSPTLPALPPGLMERLCQHDRPTSPSIDVEIPDHVGPYRIIAARGHGGMGVVYEAQDDALGRRVAVKVLSATGHLGTKARERFRREAQAAANLRHPNLVPVFAAEVPDSGPPYLVMPFIDGPTLADLVAEHRVLEPRRAAELARQVTDALTAAHAAGIIHRDVKPANILVDAVDGAAKLTDFGLARRPDHAPVTTAGTIAGTPHYLSPEQIRTPDAIDARADVYALGATLYECLTGVPPFRGGTLEILRMIGDREPVPPRDLNRDVPRDLETIALKCLEKDPARRYPSAAALRDDLARYLAGLPIQARPQGVLTRFTKWTRRNRSVAALGALLALVLAAGTVTSFVLWRAAERQAAVARGLQREAEQNLRAALEVVDRFCTRVAQEELLKQPGLQPVRQKLLGDAVDHYRRFVDARRDDPAARADVADALGRLSAITLDLGGIDDSISMRRDALALHQRLLSESPNDPARLASVAADHVHLSEGLRQHGEYEAADREGNEAATLYDRLGPDFRFQRASALCRAVEAGMYFLPDYANPQFQRVVDLLEALLAASPSSPDVKAELAGALHTWAANRMTVEDIPRLERARRLRSELVGSQPDEVRHRIGLADTAMNLGILYKWSERLPEAEAAYRQALDSLSRVVEENPRVVRWRRSLARAHYNLALLLERQSKHDESLEHFEAARSHFVTLSRSLPGDVPTVLDFCLASIGSARSRASLGHADEAASALDQFVSQIRDVSAAPKASARQRAMTVEMVSQYAVLAHEIGRGAQGDDLIDRAIDDFTREADLPSVDTLFGLRADLASAHAPDQLPAIVDRWNAKLPDSAFCSAWRGRLEAASGHADLARDLFARATAAGWKPDPEWLALPELHGLLSPSPEVP